jgi:hypothetical protein
MIDEKEIAQQPRYENVNESREAEADGERPCVELDKSSEAPEADPEVIGCQTMYQPPPPPPDRYVHLCRSH